jgi:AraC family ethanolamine operon transcriptional activator
VRQSFHTTDIHEHASALPGWQQRYDQISCGRLDGFLEVTQADEVQLFRERLNQQVVQHLQLPSGAANILIPLAWPKVDEQGVISEHHPVVLPAISEYRVVSPAGMDVLCLSIPYATLCGLLDEPLLTALGRLHLSRRVSLAPGQLAHGMRLLRRAMEGARGESRWHTLELKRELILLAVEWLESLFDHCEDLPRLTTRGYIVACCHQWLIEEPSRSPSVLELCHRLKVSRRTLQYSFQSVASMTPVQYLRSIRLNGARRALKQEPTISIADIAERWGFGHSSYFTMEYQKLFNELPSSLRQLQ